VIENSERKRTREHEHEWGESEERNEPMTLLQQRIGTFSFVLSLIEQIAIRKHRFRKKQ